MKLSTLLEGIVKHKELKVLNMFEPLDLNTTKFEVEDVIIRATDTGKEIGRKTIVQTKVKK